MTFATSLPRSQTWAYHLFHWKNLVQIICWMTVAVLLSACGGSGSAPGKTDGIPVTGTGNGSTSSNATLTINLLSADGKVSAAGAKLAADAPLTAQAKVVDGTGAPIANTIVEFTVVATFTTLQPASGQVLTDANGIASIRLTVKDAAAANAQAGAGDTIKASTTVASKVYTASTTYQLAASGNSGTSTTPSLKLVLVDSSGKANNALTPANPLTAQVTLSDSQGNAIPNTFVTFATSGVYTIIAPSSGTALTNSSGVASVNLLPKDLNTALSQIGTADSVKATVTINNTPLISSANFQFGTAGVTLSLVAPSGGNINLNAYDTTLLKVDVLVNGAPYTKEQLNINFSSTCSLNSRAAMAASAATANGRAEVVYADKGCGSTDIVTASFPGASPVTANIVVATPVAASLGFFAATPTDSAIVIKGAGGIGRSETATLTFIALDTAGKPLANQLVNFAVNSTQAVTLQTTSATTDANGKVNAFVNSGTLPTTFRVIASFANLPSISTVSGVITVSNGAPTQTAFTLTETSNNIEGWNIDNISNTVAILLADASGNPVVDGTPVVFTTDSGAIGSSSNGGCVTQNGFCSVGFRSQNPRIVDGSGGKRPGLATITASSTTALINISGQIGMFQSGSFATNVFDGSGTVAYNRSSNALTNTSCNAYSLQLEVNDINFNPMPVGTKLAVVNASTDITVGQILPVTVPNISPHKSTGAYTLVASEMAAHQGSVHTIPITLPVACDFTGTVDRTSTFTVTITSPNGGEVSYPFSLPYRTK